MDPLQDELSNLPNSPRPPAEQIAELLPPSEVLKKSQLRNYLEDLLEASFDGIVISDADGNVLFAIKAYKVLSGIHREEIVGHNLGDI